ncbi:MAG: recombinase family protein [Hyphomicrobium sp.]
MRVAIYARFSSELQDNRSITDQVAAAGEYAQRHGWQVVAEFSDAAISGASILNRPGLLELMASAQAQSFNAVLTESIDRLSRDLEDIAGLHKRLAYWGVKIVTLADGEVGKLHVGLKGMIASLYLDDLAQKTRRGQVGRVKAGRIPGGRCYGYDVANCGEDRGQRQINKAEATIVRRIFAEYVEGASPLAIAGRLNAEKVPSPRGGQWNASTINGSRKRLNGIISNRLYAGRIVYNRQRFVKDPTTGKRQAKPNPPDQWIEQAIPELTIVPADLFEAAQIKRAEHGGAHRLDRRRRPKHLLSGLVTCGCCGAAMIVVRDDRVGCSANRNKATCDNRGTICLSEIEKRILAVLQAELLAPDIVDAAIEAYREERNRLAKDTARARRDIERDLATVDRKISGIVTAIEAGGDPRALAARLNDLEAERRNIDARLRASQGADVVALHPKASQRYAAKVADIHAALSKGDTAARDAIGLVRELITNIVVTPGETGQPMSLELQGDAAALIAEHPKNQGATVSVAGPRNQSFQ